MSTVYLTAEDDRNLFLNFVVQKLPPQLVKAFNVGISTSISHILPFPFRFPTLKLKLKFGKAKVMKNPFPKFGNGKGMKKIHSQNSGLGREWKKSILKV